MYLSPCATHHTHNQSFSQISTAHTPMQITWPWVGRFSHSLITFKTKGNVNIELWDLCESLIVYILLSTCQWVHMALAVCKQTWCKKIYHMNRVSWLNPLPHVFWGCLKLIESFDICLFGMFFWFWPCTEMADRYVTTSTRWSFQWITILWQHIWK